MSKILKVYASTWCIHCKLTVKFLKENHIPFEYNNINEVDDDTLQKIIEVNGGVDWVIPTMEFDGQWNPGKVFNKEVLINDLRAMGIDID